MSIQDKPPTLRATGFKERIKVRYFANHLRWFPPDQRTLDIGCGWGFSLKINPRFYCVDADSACIEHLKQLGANAFLADVSAPLPFEEDFFDNAFTHDVLEHLEEDEMLALFAEARRIIRTGGHFMNVVPNHKGYVAGLHPDVGHKRFVTQHEISDAARRTGFELQTSWYTPLPEALGRWFAHNKLVTICRAT